jgi:hypothetical protein
MADLTAARAAHASRLAHRIGGEVIVQHEILAVFTLEAVDHLLILAGAQRHHAQRLRLATGEQRRAVRARQHAHFGDDLTYCLGVAPVDAQPGIQDRIAHDIGFEILQHRLRSPRIQPFFDQLGRHGFLRGAHFLVTRLLHLLLIRFGDAGTAQLVDPRLQRNVALRHLCQRPRLLRRMLRQFDNRLQHRLERRMAEIHRPEHHVLRQFLCLALHHQHTLGGAREHQVERRLLHLRHGRVQNIFAILIPDARGSDRAEERNARNRQRRRAAHQRHDVRIILHVVAQHGGDDLNLIAEIRRKQRPQRPIDQPAHQGLVLARTTLALEKPARYLARGESLLLVVHRQREEILPRLHALGTHRRAQHDGIAIAHQHCPIGLPRHLTRLEHQLAAAPVELLTEIIEHHAHPSKEKRCGKRLGLHG